MPARSDLRRSCCEPTRSSGFVAIILLFAVVWATDIAAYFAGRAVGGPKLAAARQPEEDLVGRDRRHGCAAICGGAGRAASRASGACLRRSVRRVVLSVAAQAGDLFESALKRRFGAKDSGVI